MGILKLMDFIKAKFPQAIIYKSASEYQDKVLALDASNWIYQFLIKTQTLKGNSLNMPTDALGNQTGHLIGILARVAFCFENRILPVWVFDGKPPQQKFNVLKKRKQAKEQAAKKMQQAMEEGQTFDMLKQSQRTVRITNTQKQDAKTLVKLMGLPVIEAPSQAEPQCAQIVKTGLAYGTISQDLDTLAFGCPRLIRYFNKKQQQCAEIQLQTLLTQSGLAYDQFIDFCILCGCDYSTRIQNIGPVKAYQYLKKFGNIDNILEEIANDKKLSNKHNYDDDFNYFAARKIFKGPQVIKVTQKQVQLGPFQQNEIIEFLKSKEFSEVRINNWVKKIHEANFLRT